jgi:hypothetical protein
MRISLGQVFFASALAYVMTSGCRPDTCEDQQVKVNGKCVLYSELVGAGAVPAGGSAAGGTSAGGKSSGGMSSGGTASGGGGGKGADADFGAACTTKADCGGPTDYCTFSPTEPAYCSASGCDADPSICPDGWTCFNVADFVPGEPYVCVKPPAEMPGAAGAGDGGATGAGGAGGAGGAAGIDAALGDPCTTKADCGGPTDYCATPPGEQAYCTASGCDADPSLCADGYYCFNLGEFVPGEPYICLKNP